MIRSEKSHYCIHPFHSNLRGNLLICVPPKCVLGFQNELGFPHSSVGKESACNAGDLASIPGLGRSSGEGNGNPLQYSCLDNPMDTGACQAPPGHKSQTQLNHHQHVYGEAGIPNVTLSGNWAFTEATKVK